MASKKERKNKKNGAVDQSVAADSQSVNQNVNSETEQNIMAPVTNALPTRTIAKIPQVILDAIAAGHISHDIEQVTIRAAKSPTNRDETRDFDRLRALDVEGLAIMCNGKIEPALDKPDGKDTRTEAEAALGVCDHFNYGHVLYVRASIRQDLVNALLGPEKNIEKLVKVNMDGGMYDTREEARAAVVARLKKQGKLDPTYDTPDYRGPSMAAMTAEEGEEVEA